MYIMRECKGMVPVRREFQFFSQSSMTSCHLCFFNSKQCIPLFPAFLCLGNSICCCCILKWMNFRVLFKVPHGSSMLADLLNVEAIVDTGFFGLLEEHHFAAL